MKNDKIPPNVVPRLSRYYRLLKECAKRDRISSEVLSQSSGFTAAQIRKDLAYFGQFGHRGRGYNVEQLKQSIEKILGLDRRWNIALVGAGNLGTALLGYRGFHDQGFDIVAAFDSNKKIIGRTISGTKIYPIHSLPSVVRKFNIQMVILAVPASAAQPVADEIVKSGIKAILNFAPVNLKLPNSIKVRHIDMTIEIERLSFQMLRQ